jgi:hypothetical protein
MALKKRSPDIVAKKQKGSPQGRPFQFDVHELIA